MFKKFHEHILNRNHDITVKYNPANFLFITFHSFSIFITLNSFYCKLTAFLSFTFFFKCESSIVFLTLISFYNYSFFSTQEVEELRRQIAMENQIKDPSKLSKRTKADFGDVELPAEFECCFCSSDVSEFFFLQKFYFKLFTKIP